MLSPAEIPKPRRASFLDIGGANSLSKFASSYQRAQLYIGLALERTDISPCTSPGAGGVDTVLAEAPENDPEHRGFDHLDTFAFPEPTEHTPLVRSRSKASSVEAVLLAGTSTAPQTVFNSVNTLMGIAMLSLSFGFRLSGWLVGTLILVACAWVTAYTARILGNILRRHRHLSTYGDIACLYGGPRFQAFATLTFTLDLLGALMSLVLLFADSFHILFPAVSPVVFKLSIVAVTLFMSFLPLSIISLVSLVGILCTVSIVVLIAVCGVLSPQSPGSLLHPSPTLLYPSSWENVFFSLGIFMCPWGGHPVFPELYRDMRHPKKYSRCCNVTFITTFILDFTIAAIGYLMFGATCQDTLTKNMMTNSAYPGWVKLAFSLFLGLLPVSKLALMVRPMISVYENYFDMNKEPTITYKNGRRMQHVTWTKLLSRCALLLTLFTLSMVFTSFGKVIAFFGSAICFTICVTFPLMFHLKFDADDMSTTLRYLVYVGIAVSILGAALGTYGTIVSTAA